MMRPFGATGCAKSPLVFPNSCCTCADVHPVETLSVFVRFRLPESLFHTQIPMLLFIARHPPEGVGMNVESRVAVTLSAIAALHAHEEQLPGTIREAPASQSCALAAVHFSQNV